MSAIYDLDTDKFTMSKGGLRYTLPSIADFTKYIMASNHLCTLSTPQYHTNTHTLCILALFGHSDIYQYCAVKCSPYTTLEVCSKQYSNKPYGWHDIVPPETISSMKKTFFHQNIHIHQARTRQLPSQVKGLSYVEVLWGVNHLYMCRPLCWSFHVVKELELESACFGRYCRNCLSFRAPKM